MNGLGLLIIIAIVALIVLWFISYFLPVGLWFSALVSGVRISLIQLVLMRFRKVPPSVIVNQMIAGTKAGLNLQANDLEAHYLAGGNVPNVVTALISAQKANIALDFKMAAAIDLAGRNVAEAVQMSVNPKVINTPPVAAVAKDGIQLIAKARVTVRANIKQLVGGAGEDTVLARVGEGIVSSIGSSDSHKSVLENPDFISRVVLEKGLDAGTAFEILSIDIADIDVGKNIGAVLQMDQANADKNIAQAKAEEKRAMAVAMEQEMKAKAQEARAKVILAEAEIPMAIAEAFRSGNLGVMDYYKLQNVQADTRMREGIVKTEKKYVAYTNNNDKASYSTKELTENEYNVLIKKGTEIPFTGDLLNVKEDGIYTCKICGMPLFHSEAKFNSGTGWPSFDDAIKENIKLVKDGSRLEVVCANCGGHMGHVFYNEGFTEKQTRYCINSVSLNFVNKFTNESSTNQK